MTSLFALACDLVGVKPPPQKRPDYTASINGQSYPLADRSDEGELIIVWTDDVPACPECHAPLLADDDEDGHRAPAEAFSAWYLPRLRCASCRATFAMEAGR